MEKILLKPRLKLTILNKVIETLTIALLFAALILGLFYAFDHGAVILAEEVISVNPPEPW